MPVLSRDQIRGLWIKYGGDPNTADTAAGIALDESGGNTASQSGNTDPQRSTDWGLFQRNSYWNKGSQADIQNVEAHIKWAIATSKNGTDWHDWCTAYSDGACGKKGGSYLGHAYRSGGPGGSGGGSGGGGGGAATTHVSDPNAPDANIDPSTGQSFSIGQAMPTWMDPASADNVLQHAQEAFVQTLAGSFGIPPDQAAALHQPVGQLVDQLIQMQLNQQAISDQRSAGLSEDVVARTLSPDTPGFDPSVGDHFNTAAEMLGAPPSIDTGGR